MLAAPALADGGGVRGYVFGARTVESAHEVVVGATVTATNVLGNIDGEEYQTRSGARGFYAFIGLPPGRYYARAEKSGSHSQACELPFAVEPDVVSDRNIFLYTDPIIFDFCSDRTSLVDPGETADVYDVQ